MKKILLAFAAALMSVSLSAQVFVGGSLGINTKSTRNDLGTASTVTSTSAINITPNVGYILNDRLSVGSHLDLVFGSPANNNSLFGFGINPYARYNVLFLGNFSIAAEAGIQFDLARTSTQTGQKAVTSNTAFGIYAVPVLLYALNDRITLETTLNVCNFSFNTARTKTEYTLSSGAREVTGNTSTSAFNLGATSNNIFGSLSAITIGFTYKLF